MATLTIRRLSERTHALLRARAAEHGRSVEAEVRAILDDAALPPGPNLLLAVRDAFAVDAVDLVLPERRDRPREIEIE